MTWYSVIQICCDTYGCKTRSAVGDHVHYLPKGWTRELLGGREYRHWCPKCSKAAQEAGR